MGDWAASRLRSWPSDGLKMAHLQKCESWDNSRERECVFEREREKLRNKKEWKTLLRATVKQRSCGALREIMGKKEKERENIREKESE